MISGCCSITGVSVTFSDTNEAVDWVVEKANEVLDSAMAAIELFFLSSLSSGEFSISDFDESFLSTVSESQAAFFALLLVAFLAANLCLIFSVSL